jgi:hypothetical protein
VTRQLTDQGMGSLLLGRSMGQRLLVAQTGRQEARRIQDHHMRQGWSEGLGDRAAVERQMAGNQSEQVRSGRRDVASGFTWRGLPALQEDRRMEPEGATTREDWERGWSHIKGVFGDRDPDSLTLEDLSLCYNGDPDDPTVCRILYRLASAKRIARSRSGALSGKSPRRTAPQP